MNEIKRPVLTVVIVSYNVKDFLLNCLHSVNEFITLPKEIIVIDNASQDGTQAAIKEKFPDIQLIESNSNLGFSAANNLGFSKSHGEYILMLNPDAFLLDDSILKALSYLQKNSDKNILVGPRIFNPDNTFQQSAWKFPKLRQHFLESVFLNKLIDTTTYPETSTTKELLQVDFISGAGILMSKETQIRIGPLDENLFWMDDVDFCYRNQMQGGKTIYFPEWIIKHHIGQSSKKNLKVVISNQLISKLKFYKKHKRTFNFYTSFFIFELHIVFRILLLIPVMMISKPAANKWKAYLYAFVKILRYLFLKDERVA